jgi:hypothetical protein
MNVDNCMQNLIVNLLTWFLIMTINYHYIVKQSIGWVGEYVVKTKSLPKLKNIQTVKFVWHKGIV